MVFYVLHGSNVATRSIPAVRLCLVDCLGAVGRAGRQCFKGSHLFRQTGNVEEWKPEHSLKMTL